MKKYYQFTAEQNIAGVEYLTIGVKAESEEEALKLVKKGDFEIDDAWAEYAYTSNLENINLIGEVPV